MQNMKVIISMLSRKDEKRFLMFAMASLRKIIQEILQGIVVAGATLI